MDSVHDGATLQILYEGAHCRHGAEGPARLRCEVRGSVPSTRQRTPEELEAIKQKYGASGLKSPIRFCAPGGHRVAYYAPKIGVEPRGGRIRDRRRGEGGRGTLCGPLARRNGRRWATTARRSGRTAPHRTSPRLSGGRRNVVRGLSSNRSLAMRRGGGLSIMVG
jgi:hypothetical protein